MVLASTAADINPRNCRSYIVRLCSANETNWDSKKIRLETIFPWCGLPWNKKKMLFELWADWIKSYFFALVLRQCAVCLSLIGKAPYRELKTCVAVMQVSPASSQFWLVPSSGIHVTHLVDRINISVTSCVAYFLETCIELNMIIDLKNSWELTCTSTRMSVPPQPAYYYLQPPRHSMVPTACWTVRQW